MTATLENQTKKRLHLTAPLLPGDEQVLTPDALEFVASLHREFSARRLQLLEVRKKKQRNLDQGIMPVFLPETHYIREGNWTVAPIPAALQDRRVEITGPVDRKMIINALNSGAKIFMADFEDSTSPTWRNIVEGQINLMDAVRSNIEYESEEGKIYSLTAAPAVLKVRPRGWHLEEKHLIIDGQPASASLVDFGLFVYHNGGMLAVQKKGPFFYLPKLEGHHEAGLWDDVFLFAERSLGIPRGTIKATVLIETITAAFEMEEIIYQLREHIAGLNAGRWDYIFSIIKKLKNHRDFVMPDRSSVTMTVPFMNAYAQLIVKTCHKRGIHAIGGMSAFIPSKDDVINQIAFGKISSDKMREAHMGYDGTWVAHPKLVSLAQKEFDSVLGNAPHQKHKLNKDVSVTPRQLLEVHSAGGKITAHGVRTNINVALLYIEAWLCGTGAVALYNLMEDAATAEISRAQLWQWLHHKDVFLDQGKPFTLELYLRMAEEELNALRDQFRKANRDVENLNRAEEILTRLVLSDDFEDFLTTLAYHYL